MTAFTPALSVLTSNFSRGDKACAWLDAFLTAKGITDTVNIVDIQGTIGASAQIGRTGALKMLLKHTATGTFLLRQPVNLHRLRTGSYGILPEAV